MADMEIYIDGLNGKISVKAISMTFSLPASVLLSSVENKSSTDVRFMFLAELFNLQHLLFFDKQKEDWKDEHGMEKTTKDLGRLIEAHQGGILLRNQGSKG